MAKLPLKTPNPFSALLMIFLFSLLLLKNVRSESLSFNFSSFGPEQELTLGFLGDARATDGVLELTRTDGPNGSFLPSHSVGRVVYFSPVHLWDKTTGKLADFTTDFSFVVNRIGHLDRADGLSFFIMPFDAEPKIPTNSSGGYLGLFSPETAFNPNKNQIVAVEFDSFENDWDPKVSQPIDAPHIGFDINSLSSMETIPWPINLVPDGTIGTVRIKYDSNAKQLSAVFNYGIPIQNVGIALTIDLRGVLPEWVRIGFSAATGDKVETHEILSWSFSASI